MAFQILSQTTAFGPGSKVWVVPPLSASYWTQQLDWYLNFLLSRARLHEPVKISPELESILTQNEIMTEATKDMSEKPLMAASQGRLPCSILVEMPTQGSAAKWVPAIHKMWLNMQKPTLRVFLHENLDVDQFSAAWPEKSIQGISLV